MKPISKNPIKPVGKCHWCNKTEDKQYSCFAQPELKFDEPCSKIDQSICGTAKVLD